MRYWAECLNFYRVLLLCLPHLFFLVRVVFFFILLMTKLSHLKMDLKVNRNRFFFFLQHSALFVDTLIEGEGHSTLESEHRA